MKPNQIFRAILSERQSRVTFDSWMPGQLEEFNTLRNVSGDNFFKDYNFYVVYNQGGGAGMGAYPPTITVYVLTTFKEL